MRADPVTEGCDEFAIAPIMCLDISHGVIPPAAVLDVVSVGESALDE